MLHFSAQKYGFLYCALISILCSLETGAQHPQRFVLDLDAQPSRPFLGLGVEFDPYPQPVESRRWDAILEAIKVMRPGFFRVMSSATDYCSGFDEAGAPHYRWKSDGNDRRLQALLAVLDFAQQQGTEVYLGEWSPPRALGIQQPDDPRWARIIADFIAYLVRDHHYTVIHHYIFMNEPNGQWMWPDRTPDFERWSKGVRLLRKELDERGLQDVQLTGPDNSGDAHWLQRSVDILHSVFGSWEQHIYADDEQVDSGALERQLTEEGKLLDAHERDDSPKERFIGESGLRTGKVEALDQQPRVHDFDYGVRMASYVTQVARAGWSGADAWDLDDAMHSNGHGGLKVWGFFDSTTEVGLKPRPWYYAWTMLSHALPCHAVILPLQGDSREPVRAVAARWTKKNKLQWSIVLVNNSDRVASVSVSAPGNAAIFQVRYLERDQPWLLGGQQVTSTPITGPGHVRVDIKVCFPSRGMIVLTTDRE